jgi:hypothetical protein
MRLTIVGDNLHVYALTNGERVGVVDADTAAKWFADQCVRIRSMYIGQRFWPTKHSPGTLYLVGGDVAMIDDGESDVGPEEPEDEVKP